MPLVGALKRLLPRVAALPLVAGLLVWPGVAAAQAPLYTVEKVEVDATAGSATAARKTGLAQAHVRAFNRLVERLVLRSELDRVPELDADRIATRLRDFEVFNERTSDVRYLAEVTFRFQPESIRQFLRDNDIPFAVTRSKPVVVLPVWGEGEDAVLWGNPNPWREAWADRAEQTGLVPLTVPLGDLGDITAVSAQNALDSDRDALKTLAERYGAADVLVTQARLAGDPEAFTASMQVITSRIGTPDMERTLVDSVQQQREEPLERMLARAADRVARDVEETWKRANLLEFDQRNRLRVEVPLDGLARWVTVRERLDRVARIEDYALTAMTRATARLEIAYFGAQRQLALALRQNDLVLERKNPDGSTTAVATRERGSDDRSAQASGDRSARTGGEVGSMGWADDPENWLLRAAEMRTAGASGQTGGGTDGGTGAETAGDGRRPASGAQPSSGSGSIRGSGATGNSGRPNATGPAEQPAEP